MSSGSARHLTFPTDGPRHGPDGLRDGLESAGQTWAAQGMPAGQPCRPPGKVTFGGVDVEAEEPADAETDQHFPTARGDQQPPLMATVHPPGASAAPRPAILPQSFLLRGAVLIPSNDICRIYTYRANRIGIQAHSKRTTSEPVSRLKKCPPDATRKLKDELVQRSHPLTKS